MLKKWFENFLDESHCKHKYSFIKMQDNEDFKSGKLGVQLMCIGVRSAGREVEI